MSVVDARWSSPWWKRAARTGMFVAVVAAAILVVWEPWHGPILLSVSTTHGVDAGDLLALPAVALAVVLGVRTSKDWRDDRTNWKQRTRWTCSISAAVLGGLLLLVSVGTLTSSGAPLPAGGGTFAGTVKYAGGHTESPVGAWSYVALTYDGTVLRMYVNGTEVSRQELTGTIQTSTHPLWIGGNHPYGEYFKGVIDEVRVYDRALDQSEIASDMATPIEPTTSDPASMTSTRRIADPSLVASYAFEAGSGTEAIDSSGHGNVGEITGATWTRGRFGHALSFNRGGDSVRVPASSSLDLRSAMTLSAWIRPSVSQGGWRTIVQRETDAYFLDASSDLWARGWPPDDATAAVVVGAAAWFGVEMLLSNGRWSGQRRRSWRVPVVVFLAGWLLDAALAPAGTVFGPMFLATWFAGTVGKRAQAVIGWLLVAACVLVTIVSLTDVGDVGIRLARNDGGATRAAALGALLVVSGALRLRPAPHRAPDVLA